MGLRTYVVDEPAKRVKVRLRSNVIGDDGRDWFAGETHECNEHLARDLVRRGRAEYIGTAPKEA